MSAVLFDSFAAKLGRWLATSLAITNPGDGVELDDRKIPRPRSTERVGLGDQRYALLRAAFAHAQSALIDGYPLEAIAVLESLITDRLGSMVHGSLGADVKLGDSLGSLIKIAQKNTIISSLLDGSAERKTSSRKSKFPDDIVAFVGGAVTSWWKQRSEAIHAMAKVRLTDDRSFQGRHDALVEVALEGIRILITIDGCDIRERGRNGAGRPATAPNALALSDSFRERVDQHLNPAN